MNATAAEPIGADADPFVLVVELEPNPPPGGLFNVILAERWDDGQDCAAGRCRDLGSCRADEVPILRAAALALQALHRWPGEVVVTDGYGRRLGILDN